MGIDPAKDRDIPGSNDALALAVGIEDGDLEDLLGGELALEEEPVGAAGEDLFGALGGLVDEGGVGAQEHPA